MSLCARNRLTAFCSKKTIQERYRSDTERYHRKRCVGTRAATHQQGAVVVQLPQHDAAVQEQVSGADAAQQVAHRRRQAGVQTGVDVKLPGIGRFLHLQKTGNDDIERRK